MRLSESLLERAEDFFDLVPCTEGDVELNSAIDELRCLLERDVDGWGQGSEEELATSVQNRLEVIWDQIPREVACDEDLREAFEILIELLDEVIESNGREPKWVE